MEGDTEAIVFRELLKDIKDDIFVLNAGSKTNITFFQEVLTEFRIRHVVVHDSDTEFSNRRKKSGERKKNSAWRHNETIWNWITKANQLEDGLAWRFVFQPNFEQANEYEPDTNLGKPMSAYNFATRPPPEDGVVMTLLKHLKDHTSPIPEHSMEQLDPGDTS